MLPGVVLLTLILPLLLTQLTATICSVTAFVSPKKYGVPLVFSATHVICTQYVPVFKVPDPPQFAVGVRVGKFIIPLPANAMVLVASPGFVN